MCHLRSVYSLARVSKCPDKDFLECPNLPSSISLNNNNKTTTNRRKKGKESW
jgi:hypothetical protein